MRTVYIIMVIFIMAGCGAGDKEDLPMSIFIQDDELREVTGDAIEALENVFGNLFIITENKHDSRIQIECDKDGWLDEMGYAGYAYESGQVLIRCGYKKERTVGTIGHELWHMLGFWEHSDDESCLNYAHRRLVPIEDAICQEMIDKFYEKYPEAK